MSKYIQTEVDETGVAIVTLDKPARRNACSRDMWERLGPLFGELGARSDVRAVVLTGSAGHFCAGADISEFAELRTTEADIKRYEDAGAAAAIGIRDCPKPTIAAVHGFGVGGGCALALSCDLRVGDATTRMGIPAAKRAIVYSRIDTELLLRQVGLSNAKRVLYTAGLFAVDECLSMGLLDMRAEAALPGAIAQARLIADNAPLSVRGAKLMLESMAQGLLEANAARIDAAAHAAVSSEDYVEATTSFMEKRPARFKGR